jgi:hypothetical protein
MSRVESRDVIFNVDDGPERVTTGSLTEPGRKSDGCGRKSDGAWPEVWSEV